MLTSIGRTMADAKYTIGGTVVVVIVLDVGVTFVPLLWGGDYGTILQAGTMPLVSNTLGAVPSLVKYMGEAFGPSAASAGAEVVKQTLNVAVNATRVVAQEVPNQAGELADVVTNLAGNLTQVGVEKSFKFVTQVGAALTGEVYRQVGGPHLLEITRTAAGELSATMDGARVAITESMLRAMDNLPTLGTADASQAVRNGVTASSSGGGGVHAPTGGVERVGADQASGVTAATDTSELAFAARHDKLLRTRARTRAAVEAGRLTPASKQPVPKLTDGEIDAALSGTGAAETLVRDKIGSLSEEATDYLLALKRGGVGGRNVRARVQPPRRASQRSRNTPPGAESRPMDYDAAACMVNEIVDLMLRV